MTDAPDTAQALLEEVQGMARKVGEEFTDPGEDWMPMGFIVTEDREQVILGLDPTIFNSGASKTMLVRVLANKLREDRAVSFALLLSTYMIHTEPKPGTSPEEVRKDLPDNFADHPDAVEMLILHAFDGRDTVFSCARIERTDTAPPTLGEWDDRSMEGTMGRFVEPFRDAMIAIRREREEAQ